MAEIFAVVGASGRTGRVVAKGLIEAGKKVRVTGRDPKKLAALSGVEIASGSLEDFDVAVKAFAGASAAYVMIPPNFTLQQGGFRAHQNRLIQTAIEGLRRAGTRHVVTLSSVGAHLGVGVGPVGGMYDMEKAFALYLPKANVLHLRAAYFMENFIAYIPMIKSTGIIGSATSANVPVPVIATRDIGAVAARYLLERGFKGHSVQELLGPRDVTMTEVARVLGAAVGKPDLAYVAFSYADAIKGMVQAGLPEELASQYAELSRAFNEGVRPTQPRDSKSTTPTTLEEFAKTVFAPAFAAA